MKNIYKVLLIVFLVVVILSIIVYSKRENENMGVGDNIRELIGVNEEGNKTESLENGMTSEALGININYPSNWEANESSNCTYNLNPWGHDCLIIENQGYKLIILGFNENVPKSDELMPPADYDNSEKFDIDGKLLLRTNYINTTEVIPEYINIIMNVLGGSEGSYKEVSQDITVGSRSYTILYSAPRDEIVDNQDLTNSAYIQTMDQILQSIDWDNN